MFMQLGCCCTQAPQGCRAIWTPDVNDLWQSTLNGWTGNAALDKSSMGSIQGNDVLSGSPWGLQQNGLGLKFSQPLETAGPLVTGGNLDSFSVGSMPLLPWLFTGDPENACVDSVATSVPTSTNDVFKENTTALPANLTDAEIQALGAANNWPGSFGSAEIFGPVISFNYTETFNSQATFTIANGQHRLAVVISIEVGARQNVKVAKLTVTGSYPNRVGVFSISDPRLADSSGPSKDAYSLEFDWRWNSVVRPNSFYTDNNSQIETMTETASFSGKGWTENDGRFGYSGALTVLAPPVSNSVVTLPTFTNIIWEED